MGPSIGGIIPKIAPWVAKFQASALLVWLRAEVYRNLGACLSPHNAYLQTLGLETLSLRAQRSCENALAVAEYLDTLPAKFVPLTIQDCPAPGTTPSRGGNSPMASAAF